MALCSTGCMSMGGSDGPRSINCELGVPGSSTICLNSPTVRTLAGVPAGAISLCNFYGKVNAPYTVEYLVLAGGGSSKYAVGTPSGTNSTNAGSGAGGLLTGSFGAKSNQAISIQVGAGGGSGTNGTNSCLGCFMTTCGGGSGGSGVGTPSGTSLPACCGGSGGGAGYVFAYGAIYQGACSINNEGNCGGGFGNPGGYGVLAGGGGGRSTAGGFAGLFGGSAGGQGCFYPFNQVFSLGPLSEGCYWIAGGGGGGGGGAYGSGAGGLGGGGSGSYSKSSAEVGQAGQANTGGGAGGGTGCAPPAAGGSGSVFLRYPSNIIDAPATTGSPCYCCTGGYKYYWFRGSGSITLCC